MQEKQKRILAGIVFIATLMIFVFAYLFINQDDVKQTAAKDTPVEEKQKAEENKAVSEETSVEKDEKSKEVAEAENKIFSIDEIPILRAYTEDDSLEFAATKNGWSEKELFSVAQEDYMRGIGFDLKYEYYSQSGVPAIDFNFDKQFSTFKGKIGVDDLYSNSPILYHLLFISEDRDKNQVPIYKSESIRGGDYPIDFEIDVTDVERLVIKVIREGEENDYRETRIVLVDTEIQ